MCSFQEIPRLSEASEVNVISKTLPIILSREQLEKFQLHGNSSAHSHNALQNN